MPFAIDDSATAVKTTTDVLVACFGSDESTTSFWDWHSYLLVSLLSMIAYHCWSFRALYRAYFVQLTGALVRRVWDVEMVIELGIISQATRTNVTVWVTPMLRIGTTIESVEPYVDDMLELNTNSTPPGDLEAVVIA